MRMHLEAIHITYIQLHMVSVTGNVWRSNVVMSVYTQEIKQTDSV